MFDLLLTGNKALDMARWAVTATKNLPCSPFHAWLQVEQKATVLSEALDNLTGETRGSVWVWKCAKCNGWHGTVGMPEKCLGLSEETLETAAEHISASRRKSSKSGAWFEAERAAGLLGTEARGQKERPNWPDLEALAARLESLRS